MTPSNPLFQRTILFSINITALYTNIFESDGKESSRKACDSHSTLIPPTLCSVHLLTTFFLQINMTPSYGNALMTKLEKKKILLTSLHQPISSFRFIDDAALQWNQSGNKIKNCFHHGYNAHHVLNIPKEFLKPK